MLDLRHSLACIIIALCGLTSFAAEVRVSDPESTRKAVLAAKPGDVIVLSAGEWKDADLRLYGTGTKDAPITIRAEKPGETIFTGASRIRLGGEHLVVSGLWLKNLSGAKADWFEFRIDSKRRANHCRVTDCAFTEAADFTPEEKESRWVGIYGAGNQLDRCFVEGKKNKGTTVVVWLGEQDTGGHRLLANRFGKRPRLGQNGGEALRVGDSKSSMMKASCLIEGNIFYRCDGETECISNKSCGNIYRGNFFLETQGTLTLRHGNDCLVEGNVFLGGKRNQTGGIRVIGEGHQVVGNYLRDLEGDSFRSAICLVNGFPESADNGYFQVKNTLIRDNLILNCKESILIGHNDEEEAILAPDGVVFEGNRIRAREGRPAVLVERTPTGMVWKLNKIEGEIIGTDEQEGMRGEPSAFPEFPAVPPHGTSWQITNP